MVQGLGFRFWGLGFREPCKSTFAATTWRFEAGLGVALTVWTFVVDTGDLIVTIGFRGMRKYKKTTSP